MNIQILAQKFYDYSFYMRGRRPATIRRYRQAINLYSRLFEISEIEQVTEANVRQFFFDGRTKRNWKPNSFICFYHSLTVFFKWCVSEKYLTKNPIEDMEIPKVEKRLSSCLTKQDALKLLEVVYNYPHDYKFLRYRNHAIFSAFIFSGLRKNELLKLKYNDVDVENLSIFVNQGKGGKDRIIPMCYTLAQSLKRYIDECKRLNKTCPEFFASLNRNCGFTDMGLRNLVRNIRKASRIKFTIHKLRHTFATLMLNGGCDIYSLSKMMGHSDIKTTTIYLSASAEHLRLQMTKHPLNNII